MSKRPYTHVQALLPEIKAKQLLARERRKEAKIKAGMMPRPKGRSPKDAPPRDIVAG